MNLYGIYNKDEDKGLKLLNNRKEMRLQSRKMKEKNDLYDNAGVFVSNKDLQGILDKLDPNNFNIDMKQLDELQSQMGHYSKEYGKHLKKIKGQASSIYLFI
jgi:sulfur relay (sulfurtransferase) DsrF/TusC family protein